MCSKNYSLEEIKNECSDLEQEILKMYLNRVKQKDICNALQITRDKIDTLEISSIKAVYSLLKFLYSYHPNIGILRKKERAMQHIKNYELKI